MSIEGRKQTVKTKHYLLLVVLCAAVLLAGCAPRARVGNLQTESQSIELGDAESVRIEITFGAGDLEVSSGAADLLEADFAYNVAMLKPEVDYSDGQLVISQPDTQGFPDLRGISDFRNEWDLRLNEVAPIDLSIDAGGGAIDLRLAELSLTRLDIELGACEGTVDLSGDWERDFDAVINVGAANILVFLPSDVGVRVEVDAGPTAIQTSGLSKDGNVYTNDAYGESAVTVRLHLETGIGLVNMEVVEAE
jgi:hypothetical protein